MSSRNAPRGRRDANRPRSKSARRRFVEAIQRLDRAIAGMPLGHQPHEYIGHAKVIDQFTAAVQHRKTAGQPNYEDQ